MIGKPNFLQRGFILVLLTFTCMACLVSSSEIENPASCCSDGLGLNYTIPMFHECKKERHPNGSWVQKIPKIIPYTAEEAACPRRKSKLGIPPGHRVCRFPYCIKDRCKNGWCEETMKGYKCHCSRGYRGSDCSSQSTSPQTDRPVPPADPTPHCPTSTSTAESTYTQDDTTTTTTTLSPTAANSESFSTQDDTTITDSTTALSTTAANSESISTQDDTTTTTTTLSTTAADSESTSTQDDTTTTTTLSPTAADYDEDITTEGSTNPQFSPASPGWKCTSSKCYSMYDEPQQNWADARTFCSELDPVNTTYGYRSPSLLFLNTEEEAREILALQLGLTYWMWVWINCNDRSTEGEFVCDVDGNGTQPSSFWWDQGQPNSRNHGHDDCVAVNRGWSELLKWHDVTCSGSWKRYTMCQYIVGQPEQ